MEVFSLITGILYLLLEIRQKNAMWIVGILTSGAAVVVFANEHLYASMCLNIYYVIISFWGLYTWKRDARKVASEEIHLEKLTLRTGLLSILLLTGGTAFLLLCSYDIPVLVNYVRGIASEGYSAVQSLFSLSVIIYIAVRIVLLPSPDEAVPASAQPEQ